MSDAESALKLGTNFPYDAGCEWWDSNVVLPPPPPKDWAHAAARGVLADLTDRRGIKHALDDDEIDHETRAEIVEALAAIIRLAEQRR